MGDTFIKPGIYIRYQPQAAPAPVLIDVSRSGREYPPDFRSPLPFTVLHDNVSMYVEDLYAVGPSLGASLLYACFPNTYIDTNRNAADIDESLIEGKWPGTIKQSDFTSRGLGLLKRLSRYGEPLQERKLTISEVQQRLAIYHEPYHAELARLLSEMKRQHGVAFQLSCHCMSAVGAPTHADPGKLRADFNLGNMNGGLRAKRYRRRGERRRPRLLIGAPRRRFGAWPSRLNVRLLSDDIFCGMIGGRRKGPLSSSDVAVRTRIGGPKAGLGRRAAAKRATGLGGLIT
jgi:N-formylglutamate amidohydrolase